MCRIVIVGRTRCVLPAAPNTFNPFTPKERKKQKTGTYKVNSEARSRNHCYRGKEIIITYSECVFVALGINRVKRISRIILSSVVCSAPKYFYILSQNLHDFRKKKNYTNLMHMKCVS